MNAYEAVKENGLVMNTGGVLLHRAARGVNNKVVRAYNGADQEAVALVLSYLMLLWMDGGLIFVYAGGELKDTIAAPMFDDLDGRYNNTLQDNDKTHSKLNDVV